MDIIPEATLRMLGRMPNHLDWGNAHYEVGKAEDIIPRWYKGRLSSRCSYCDPP